jgi:hypothetical protein
VLPMMSVSLRDREKKGKSARPDLSMEFLVGKKSYS